MFSSHSGSEPCHRSSAVQTHMSSHQCTASIAIYIFTSVIDTTVHRSLTTLDTWDDLLSGQVAAETASLSASGRRFPFLERVKR